MAYLRAFITYALFPLTFVGGLIGAAQAYASGADADLVLALTTAITVAIVALCERIHPHVVAWNQSQQDVATDLVHSAVSMVILPQLLELALRSALLGLASAWTVSAGDGLWPTQWPLVLQLGLAMLVTQFAEYWLHRGMHELPLLWRLHATHHSPGRLYWLNAGRFHPLDSALSFSATLSILLLLGAGTEVMLLTSVWIAIHGLFQHCNIRLRLGPLNYIFSMAELHRWHHSKILREANANYGNNIIFWDLVFRTLHYPRDRDASANIGLSDMPHFPTTWWAQILSPFRWRHVTRDVMHSNRSAEAETTDSDQAKD